MKIRLILRKTREQMISLRKRHRSLIHYSRNSSKRSETKEQCQRVARSSIDLWKMPFTSRSIGSRKLALTMTRYKNSRIPRSFWYRPRRAFLPAWSESRPRFETQNTRSRNGLEETRRFLYRNFRSPREHLHNTSEVAVVRSRHLHRVELANRQFRVG